MPTKTESIKAVLTAKTHEDLAKLYSKDMECQVNVASDGAQRISGVYQGKNWNGFTDGIQTWKSFRIPYNANIDPSYEDTQMSFDLGAHYEGIGMTGWDWANRLSRWVAFDFDAIVGHSEKHTKKLTDKELEEVQSKLMDLDWVTIRKSTSGSGLHIYVFLDPVTTKNHNEHAALARAILGKMSALSGVDFSTKVDACGQNMWVLHRKMDPPYTGNQGLSLVKDGSVLKDIPIQWRDHLLVIKGERRQTLPKFFNEATPATDKFEELSSQICRITLDDQHKRFLRYLEEKSAGSWWDSDHYMLVTHTYWLKQAFVDLELRGAFKTLSEGQDAPTDINCFGFPLGGGGWVFRRYSLGVAEAESWDQDNKGFTRCYYNIDPDFKTAARIKGGTEDTDGSFVFNEAAMALEAARLLGVNMKPIPSRLNVSSASIKETKDGRLVLQVDGGKYSASQSEMEGWLLKKNKWIKIVKPMQENLILENDGHNLDSVARHLVSTSGEDAGWLIKGAEDIWIEEPLSHVALSLDSLGYTRKQQLSALGSSVMRCWKLVNKPFAPEYPGNRTWNRNAAQMRFVPSQHEELHFPSWNLILEHCGHGLTPFLQDHPWARENGVLTGAQYLKLWIASVFKEPTEPLPYLFLYSEEQNTGKSIFHESLSLLLTKGYVRADHALVNPSGFNEELAASVICVVEEINLRKDKIALGRIKDMTTSRQLSIHPKGRTPYLMINTAHFIQAANSRDYCPILAGDTRIVMIYVEPLKDPIPKKVLIQKLEKEASDFLAELLRTEIPYCSDRLNIPVITTLDKINVQQDNRTPVEDFLANKCFQVEGEFVVYHDLYEAFKAFIDPNEVNTWSIVKFGKELPSAFPRGKLGDNNKICVGNVSLSPPKQDGVRRSKFAAKFDATGKNSLLYREEPK